MSTTALIVLASVGWGSAIYLAMAARESHREWLKICDGYEKIIADLEREKPTT
ncbi:hypothetical protein M0R72_12710 [Candidatus Pacearchaeota archaeon]|jgi:hypothetical protein|nr:hypothetical protein [Candidatus Pacearchaeota archaeon]